MRREYIVIALALVLLLPSQAVADKYAAEFLKIGAGARALGMGGAFVALADDVSAIYWNPAGVVSVTAPEVEAMHAEQFGEIINYDFLAVAFPLSSPGEKKTSLGAAFIRLSVDDIPYTKNLDWEDFGIDGTEGTSDEGEGNGKWDPGERILLDEGKIVWKNNADMALMFSYGSKLTEKLSIGGTFKLVRQELMDNSSLGAGVDVGIIYALSSSASAGLVVSDATTTQLSWDTGHHEFVAPTVRLGGQYTKQAGPFDGIGTVALDTEIGFERRELGSQLSAGPITADFKIGVEYWLKRAVALRTGLNAGRFTAGAGARFSGFGFDYAFVSHKDLDNSHRISASFRF